MTADDVPAGLRLSRQSHWNQTEADWRLLIEPPSFVRLALAGERVVGSAGAVVYGDQLAWVCMVLVEVAERGHGLGTQLVTDVLSRVPRTLSVGLDATPQGRPVYERLGFRAAADLTRLETTSAVALAGSARPMTEDDLPGIFARDVLGFGADRARVLGHAFRAAPEYAWCAGDRASLGYVFGRHGENADQIGPVVADTLDVARDLVSACLAARPGQRFFLDAHALPNWRWALEGLGFREQRVLTRMYRQGVRPAVRSDRSWAIFGPEFG